MNAITTIHVVGLFFSPFFSHQKTSVPFSLFVPENGSHVSVTRGDWVEFSQQKREFSLYIKRLQN